MKLASNLGMLLLGVWLVLYGLIAAAEHCVSRTSGRVW